MKKLNVMVIALAVAVAAIASAQVIRTFEGPGYTILRDAQGRCILALADAAGLPSTNVCQDGAPLFRTDQQTWYISSAGSFSAWVPTISTGTITSLTVGTETYTGAKTMSPGNGAQIITGAISENIVLNTGATTTDSSGNLIPANSIIDAVNCRVTTTITTAANWQVGDGTTAARFIPSNSNITANSASETVGLAAMHGVVSTTATGPTNLGAAAKLRITTNVNPGAGAIRCTTFYRQFVAPTS